MAYSSDTPIGTIIPYSGFYFPYGSTIEQMRQFIPGLSEQDHFKGCQNALELAESGWLLCDGRELRYTTNSNDIFYALCKALGNAWGGNQYPIGSTFRLPNLMGLFLRGVAYYSLQDPDKQVRTKIYSSDHFGESGNQVGSFQADDFVSHSHNFTTNSDGNPNGPAPDVPLTWARRGKEKRVTDNAGGSETRPKNAYVHYLIKAAHTSINLALVSSQDFENLQE